MRALIYSSVFLLSLQVDLHILYDNILYTSRCATIFVHIVRACPYPRMCRYVVRGTPGEAVHVASGCKSQQLNVVNPYPTVPWLLYVVVLKFLGQFQFSRFFQRAATNACWSSTKPHFACHVECPRLLSNATSTPAFRTGHLS